VAGNQREMRKKELKAKKDRKNKTIIWIIIAIVVAVLIVMKV
jgi:flagellar basal body-associated protein FliL